jgi:hypothetical protein
MVNGVFYFRSGSGYFRFEPPDAGFQIGHGKRIEILSLDEGQRIIGLSGLIVIHVHKR